MLADGYFKTWQGGYWFGVTRRGAKIKTMSTPEVDAAIEKAGGFGVTVEINESERDLAIATPLVALVELHRGLGGLPQKRGALTMAAFKKKVKAQGKRIAKAATALELKKEVMDDLIEAAKSAGIWKAYCEETGTSEEAIANGWTW